MHFYGDKSKTRFSDWWEVVYSLSHVRLSNPMDCSPPGPSVHGILQARILEWVATFFSRVSSRPRNRIWSPALQVDSWTTALLGNDWSKLETQYRVLRVSTWEDLDREDWQAAVHTVAHTQPSDSTTTKARRTGSSCSKAPNSPFIWGSLYG